MLPVTGPDYAVACGRGAAGGRTGGKHGEGGGEPEQTAALVLPAVTGGRLRTAPAGDGLRGSQ
jgi:hypothetical protein